MSDIDPALLVKIETAVHSTLVTIVTSVMGAGLHPKSAINMIRVHLDAIEEEAREAVVDIRSGVGDQRSIAEEWMEATHPEAAAQHAKEPDGKRGVRPPADRDNQAYYGPPPHHTREHGPAVPPRSAALRPDVTGDHEGSGGW